MTGQLVRLPFVVDKQVAELASLSFLEVGVGQSGSEPLLSRLSGTSVSIEKAGRDRKKSDKKKKKEAVMSKGSGRVGRGDKARGIDQDRRVGGVDTTRADFVSTISLAATNDERVDYPSTVRGTRSEDGEGRQEVTAQSEAGRGGHR